MGQLEGKSFQEILETYPERRLALNRVPYKTMMGMARRTKPLGPRFARNYIIAASGDPSAYDASLPLVFPVLINQPLRVYVVGTLHRNAGCEHLVVIGNATIPEGARVREANVAHPKKDHVLLPAFSCHTIELDTAVQLNTRHRYMNQVGGLTVDDLPGTRQLWLGVNTALTSHAFRFFVDQGNALRYAGIKA